jgi:hypothetical protein
MLTLACTRCVTLWTLLLQDFPFLHSWLCLLVLWGLVGCGYALVSDRRLPMNPVRYLSLALGCGLVGGFNGFGLAYGLPVIGIWLLRMAATAVGEDVQLWRVAPAYLAFHRAVAWSALLLVPAAYSRYTAQNEFMLPHKGIIVWLLLGGLALLAAALVLAHRRPDWVGPQPQPVGVERPRRRRRPGDHRLVAVLAAQRCPLCRDDLECARSLGICPGCDTLVHEACAIELGGCGTFGCRREPGKTRARSSSGLRPAQPAARLARAAVLV